MRLFTRKKVGIFFLCILVSVPIIGVIAGAIALEKLVPITSATYSAGTPQDTKIIWQDFDAFWQAVDASKQQDGSYNAQIFNDVYTQNRTDGLDNFDKVRYGGGGKVYDNYHLIPFYQSFRNQMIKSAFNQQKISEVFAKARMYYPDAPIPNVRVFMGLSNNGGTITNGDIIIAYEMFGDADGKDWNALNVRDGLKQYLQTSSIPITVQDTTEIVAHEYIHYLQLSLTNIVDRGLMKIRMVRGKNTLLDMAMVEGVASFLQSVLTGEDAKMIQRIQAYVDANGGTDKFLQQFLQKQDSMGHDDIGDWLYKVETSDGRPSDMGYWAGAMIAKKYWHKTADKQQAFMDLIGEKSYQDIVADAF